MSIVLGLILGAALGMIFGDLAVGIGVGLALGVLWEGWTRLRRRVVRANADDHEDGLQEHRG